MDGDALVEAVRAAKGTELDRLGSEKALVAETDADLSTGAVLRAAAAAEARAVETFDRWADDEADAAAREAFAGVAERERDHRDRVLAELDDPAPNLDADSDAVHDHLRGLDGTAERVGAGLVGRPLAAERTLLQVVSFFVNEADADRADLFRELRSDTQALAEEGAVLLDEVCDGEEAYERAREAAEGTVAVAYRDYADRLEAMGLDPKPVC